MACKLIVFSTGAARCDTMTGALIDAYRANPDLGQQRAGTRAADEDVARAKSGYRPNVAGKSTLGPNYTQAHNARALDERTGAAFENTAHLTVTQNLFDGNRTTSDVQGAESRVFMSRAQLRDKEQQTLLAAATAYMDVLRDTALLQLEKNDVELLIVRLREARARFKVKEITQTDVAQVGASLATAQSAYFTAQSALIKSIAAYRRVTGRQPHRLEAARPIDALLPRDIASATRTALAEHPNIEAALQAVDVATSEVHIAESRLYPTIDAVGDAAQLDAPNGNPRRNFFEGGGAADVKVPFYTGGADYAEIRRAKEDLGRARLKADWARDEVRALVETTWAELESSKELIRSANVAVQSSETALVEVHQEAAMGQRTTLDVLIAIQTLLDARVSLITAERDRVVDSYAVMAAIGRLSAANIGLPVEPYDPTVHFNLVKDKWIGLRTPDGR